MMRLKARAEEEERKRQGQNIISGATDWEKLNKPRPVSRVEDARKQTCSCALGDFVN